MEVPLRQWHVSNFKSVGDATVDFAPLTLIVGPNSSGKSSLIQSILLAVQAAQSPLAGDRVVLNGPLVSLGSYTDVVRSGSKGPIALGGVFSRQERVFYRPERIGLNRSHRYADEISWKVTFKGAPANEPGASLITRVDLASFHHDETDGQQTRVAQLNAVRAGASRKGQLPKALLTTRGFRRGVADSYYYFPFTGSVRLGLGKPTRLHAVSLSSGLPVGFLVAKDENEVQITQWFEWLTSPSAQSQKRVIDEAFTRMAGQGTFPAPLRGRELRSFLERAALALAQGLPSLLASSDESDIPGSRRAMLQYYRDSWQEYGSPDLAQRRMIQEYQQDVVRFVKREMGPGRKVLVEADEQAVPIASASTELERFLAGSVVYLGPLRQDPQAVYSPGPSSATGFLGTKGEYTAGVLHAFGAKEVICPVSDGSRLLPLTEAVSHWLAELEVGEGLDTRSLGRPGIELSLRDSHSARAQNLANVGVGVSQLVPVVVACLLSPPGSLVLLEQPELHLHPALQQRLGDFLLAIARSGRQLIVETHSDHVVSRLRLRIAKDSSNETLDAVSIIHAWRDTEGHTTYQPVEPNRFGGIDDWPPGFFDQTASEAQEIIRAALTKKAAETAGDNGAE